VVSIPECTLCGKNVESIFLAEVEGSEIEVCEDCASFGTIIKEIKPNEPKSEVVFTGTRKGTDFEEPDQDLIPDYGDKIIRVRQKKGLERKEFAMKINEKESIVRRVEMEEMIPDDKLRKKIENFLDIELLQSYTKTKIRSKPKRGELTLGDVIEIEE